MNLVFQAADGLQALMRERQWRFCFIGGLAVQHWGEPRITRDVDVTLLTGFGNEEAFTEALLTRFRPRVPDFWEKALRARVALLQDDNGVGLDVALGALPFEAQVIERSREVPFPSRMVAPDLLRRRFDCHEVSGGSAARLARRGDDYYSPGLEAGLALHRARVGAAGATG